MAPRKKKKSPDSEHPPLSKQLEKDYNRAKSIFTAGDYSSAAKLYQGLLEAEGSDSIHTAVLNRLEGLKIK